MAVHGFVTSIVVASAILLVAMTAALGPPVLKMVRSGQGLGVGRGLLLAVVLLGELGIVIALAVVVAPTPTDPLAVCDKAPRGARR